MRRAATRRVRWPILLAAGALVFVAVAVIALTGEWAVSCGQSWGGIDCLSSGTDVQVTAQSAPARWLGASVVAGLGVVSLLVTLVAAFGCWASRRPRFVRGRRGDLRAGVAQDP